jgi:hypothetical protein
MTQQPTEPTQPPGPPTEPPPTEPAPPLREPTLEQRMEDFGRRAGEAGERWGREAEATGQRWSKDPSVVRATDTAARVWGLILLAVGVWFFADITLGLDMPAVAWRDIWPLGLILIGVAVLYRGMARSRS